MDLWLVGLRPQLRLVGASQSYRGPHGPDSDTTWYSGVEENDSPLHLDPKVI